MSDTDSARTPASTEGEIDLAGLITTIWDGKWLIAAFAVCGAALGFVYAGIQTPTYTAEAVVYVESDDSSMWRTADGETRAGGSLARERDIITSRSLSSEVAQQENFDVVVTPVRMPIVGPFFANRHLGDDPSPPPVTLPDLSWMGTAAAEFLEGITIGANYGWGGEDLRISRLDVDVDRFGSQFTLVAGVADGSYLLYSGAPDSLDENETPILEGRVDETASNVDGVSMFVTSLKALPGTRFAVSKLSPPTAGGRLRGQLSVRTRETSSMLEVRLQGTDKRDVEARLQGIVDRHMRRNMERRTAEAEQQMEFLEEQLPEQRRALEASEHRYNEFRRNAESIDLRAEDQRLVTELIEIESELLSIEIERSQLRQRLQTNHPQIRQLAERENRLIDRRQQLESRLTSLPESQQQLIQLEREVGIDSAIYTQMMNSMQDVRLSRAGLVPTISVVDPVYVGSAEVPSKVMTVGGGGMLGAVLAFGMIFGRMLFRRNVEDVQQLEQATGLSVFSVILESRMQNRLDRRPLRGKQGPNLLAAQCPQDLITESLRSLRTSLHFALLGSRRHVLAFTSPTPNAGKSFTTSNLAWLVAESGKKTLLIDSDMRRGTINEIFDIGPSPGLSDILVRTELNTDPVRSSQSPNLDIITCGTHPPNPSELLMSKTFDSLLDWAEQRYDLVIIDTPPIMCVSDAVIIGARCGAVLMVTRAHVTTIPLVQHTLKPLQTANISVAGLIINGLKSNKSPSKLRYYAQQDRYSRYSLRSQTSDNTQWGTTRNSIKNESSREAAE